MEQRCLPLPSSLLLPGHDHCLLSYFNAYATACGCLKNLKGCWHSNFENSGDCNGKFGRRDSFSTRFVRLASELCIAVLRVLAYVVDGSILAFYKTLQTASRAEKGVLNDLKVALYVKEERVVADFMPALRTSTILVVTNAKVLRPSTLHTVNLQLLGRKNSFVLTEMQADLDLTCRWAGQPA